MVGKEGYKHRWSTHPWRQYGQLGNTFARTNGSWGGSVQIDPLCESNGKDIALHTPHRAMLRHSSQHSLQRTHAFRIPKQEHLGMQGTLEVQIQVKTTFFYLSEQGTTLDVTHLNNSIFNV